MAKRMKSAAESISADPRSEAALLLRRVIDDAGLRAALGELVAAASGESSADSGSGGGFGLGRLLLLSTLAGGSVLAASPALRSKLLDALFGAEEEFQYRPPASEPAAPGAV